MIIAGTGHRPNKLCGYGETVHNRLVALAEAAIKKHFSEAKEIISGMALGWDTALAIAALNLNIPLCAAIPCPDQEKLWPLNSQDRYRFILKQASRVEIITKIYSSASMQIRNEWMVDNCGILIALWDGSSGGTANCISYANRKLCPYINLWESWKKYSGFY